MKLTQSGRLLNPTELDICLWIVFLSKKQLSYHTIRSYVYTLAAEIRLRGGPNFIVPNGSWFIHITLEYFARELGTSPRITRRPLTLSELRSILDISDLTDHNTLVFCTMLAVGIFCLLRIGELCYTKSRGKPKFIANRDIIIKHDRILIHLHRTKTDQRGIGTIKTITNIKHNSINPFNLIWALKFSKPNKTKDTDPFFLTSTNRPVTVSMLTAFIRSKMQIIRPNIPAHEWSGISIRKGGATTAMRARVPDNVIEKLGHWKSSAYKSYIAHEPIDIITAQTLMAQQFST